MDDTPYNPHIPCELQDGHEREQIPGKNVNEVKLTLMVCKRCGKVRA